MYKIGIISPGKMGITLVKSLFGQHDLYCALDGRSKETILNAERNGLKNTRTLNQLFNTCSIVFCIGTRGVAIETAKSAVDSKYNGIYVDFNTLFGEESEKELYSLTESINFVDGALFGWPINSEYSENQTKRKMILSGEYAESVSKIFNPNIWEISFVHKSAKRYRRVNLF